MAYDPNLTEAERQARQYMTPDERAFVEDRRHFTQTFQQNREQRRQVDVNRAAKKDIEARALALYHRDMSGKARAERDRQKAEAKAERDRAYAAEMVGRGFTEREAEDHIRERDASDAAAKAEWDRRWALPQWQREAEDKAALKAKTPTDQPKPRPEMTVPTYDPPPPVDPTDADGMEARARSLSAKATAEPSEGNRYQALVAGAEAVKARTFTRFQALQKRADEDIAEAVRAAGDDPVARARAKAQATSARAEQLGYAEKDYQAAELAYDHAVVDTAKACRVAEYRIKSRQAQIAADEAKALNDPHALGNKYYQAPSSLARWQFDALSPEMQAKASADGVRIYEDAPPAFTADAVKSILRMRGSANRAVVTRAELDVMAPADQARAARSSIIVDT